MDVKANVAECYWRFFHWLWARSDLQNSVGQAGEGLDWGFDQKLATRHPLRKKKYSRNAKKNVFRQMLGFSLRTFGVGECPANEADRMGCENLCRKFNLVVNKE